MSPKKRLLHVQKEEGPSPRTTYALFGQDDALARAAAAIRSGRPPHAWLISGPPGIGKATLAFRMARYLLKYGATDRGPENLDVPAADAMARLAERAHPDLIVLERKPDEKGKLKADLPVEEIRRLAGFFALTAAGGWRIAIVDSADDLNSHGANALLKVLEEPPPRSMLFLIAHAPGRLLPTIRSRCRLLSLRPLEQKTLVAALRERLPDTKMEDLATLAELSEGSLGLALKLAEDDWLDIARSARAMLERGGKVDVPSIFALADKVSKLPDGLEHFGSFLAQNIADRLRRRAQAGEGGLDAYVALWERVRESFSRAVGLYLEPRQTLLSAASAARSVTNHAGR